MSRVPLMDRKHLHLSRKFYHAVIGAGYIACYGFLLDRKTSIVAASAVLAGHVALESLRFKFPSLNQKFIQAFGALLRRSEHREVQSGLLFSAAMLLLILFFPKDAALVGMACLAAGDPAASAFGICFQKSPSNLKLKNGKSLFGFLGGFAVGSAASLLTLAWLARPLSHKALAMCFFGSLAAALSEALSPLWKLDDNGTVPLAGASVAWFVSAIMEYLR